MFFLPRWSVPPKRAFTLIEVLIVIAIIGVLAALTFLTVRPDEYLERSKDSERRGAVKEIWTANESYNVFNGRYVTRCWACDSFETTIGPGVGGTKDLKIVPRPPGCPTDGTSWSAQKLSCGYITDWASGDYGVLWVKLESRAESKAAKAAYENANPPQPGKCGSNENVFWAFSTVNDKFGYICKAKAPPPGTPVQTDRVYL